MTRVPIEAVRAGIRGLVAYPIEHERVRVKLDANELGFELPAALRDAFRAVHENVDLRRYPQGHADSLLAAVGQRWGVPVECVLAGNGSNEMIALIFSAFATARGGSCEPTVVLPTPSFGVYPIQARANGWAVREVPLRPDFSLDADAVLTAAREARASAIVVSSPNNPTGNAFDEAEVERILDGFEGPVVMDEAYQPFARRSWLGRWDRWPHLLVLRSLSKVGLAALRVGFLFAEPRLTRELQKAKLPFNLNAVSASLAEVAIRCWGDFEAVAAQVASERERVRAALASFEGVTPFPSEANFVLIRVAGDADAVWSRLLERGISVRNFSRKLALANCLRVTIGSPAENDTFLAALPGVLRG